MNTYRLFLLICINGVAHLMYPSVKPLGLDVHTNHQPSNSNQEDELTIVRFATSQEFKNRLIKSIGLMKRIHATKKALTASHYYRVPLADFLYNKMQKRLKDYEAQISSDTMYKELKGALSDQFGEDINSELYADYLYYLMFLAKDSVILTPRVKDKNGEVKLRDSINDKLDGEVIRDAVYQYRGPQQLLDNPLAKKYIKLSKNY